MSTSDMLQLMLSFGMYTIAVIGVTISIIGLVVTLIIHISQKK